MGILLVDFGEVRTFELGGSTTLGRDPKNDVVIVHPTVSRQHATIEKIGNRFILKDSSSRNGTRVNGRQVQADPLPDGARIRVGHVRAWFYNQMPDPLPRSISDRSGGIVFECACGQRLWSASDTAGVTVNCVRCKRGVEVPEEGESADESSGTVSGVTLSPGQGSGEAICDVCQWPIEARDVKQACPECGSTFHAECWRDNKGCSTYGCRQVNVLLPPPDPVEDDIGDNFNDTFEGDPASTATDHNHGDHNDPHITATDALAERYKGSGKKRPKRPTSTAGARGTTTLSHLLLALAVVGSLLGILTFGLPAAVVGGVSFFRYFVVGGSDRNVLVATLFLAALGTTAGVMVSRFWWLGHPFF